MEEVKELEFEKIDLPDLVNKNDPILKTKLGDYEFKEHKINIQLADALSRKCLELNGQGLAANQLGLKDRVCVIKSNPMIVMFNPWITNSSDTTETTEEGCLSLPGLVGKVKRAKEIRVRFTHPNGTIVTDRFSGETARIMQHEIDHLNGILFPARMSFYHRQKAYKDMKLRLRRKM